MNMLNSKCRTSFAKPEFLKKAQRANPRLYDIGCYNDNLALMLALESDEVIRLEKESRSKLSDLIRPFDYEKLNNLYDLFIPQREKSPEQRYFLERSRLSHTPVNNGNLKESFKKQTTLLEKWMDEFIPLNAKSLNVNFVCATCGKCVLNEKHDMCVLKSPNGVNSRTKMPVALPVSTREPKRTVKQSVAKPLRKTVASETNNQKLRNTLRKLYKHANTKEFLSLRSSVKDIGEADVILGIRIKYESNGIAISWSHYIEKVLKKFNYFDCTLVSTPMDTSEKLMPSNGQAVSQLEYSRVISCLIYAMTCTRPDIAFVVGKLSRYTSNPGTQHWQAIQRVLKYLKKTIDYRLIYTGYPSVLEGYTNASWISNTKDNSSISGWYSCLVVVQFLRLPRSKLALLVQQWNLNLWL
nr:zinc finger, CCHC-type [Tanacetum cinerariifolium]